LSDVSKKKGAAVLETAARIVGRPWWWLLLLFVPIVNLVIGLIVTYNLAQVFGKGLGFMLGLLFLPFIFCPILAFGTATYLKPVREVH
jgi:uncharacterized membrane protein YhaH (DUF805 family)